MTETVLAMKPLLISLLVIASVACASCNSSTDDSPAKVQLTAERIALSATDTSKSVDASLSCGCPCKLQNMMVSGDTNVIRFNLDALRDEQSTHHIMATATPSAAKAGTSYSCTFSFVMHDPMNMGGMHDYSASVTATFMR